MGSYFETEWMSTLVCKRNVKNVAAPCVRFIKRFCLQFIGIKGRTKEIVILSPYFKKMVTDLNSRTI